MTEAQLRRFDHALPSLNVFTFYIPFPMTVADYEAIAGLLEAMRPALTKDDVERTSAPRAEGGGA